LASWDQQFFDAIELPNGRKLIALRDAAEYISALPDAEHGLPHACAMGRGQGAATAVADTDLMIVARGADKEDRAVAMRSIADIAGPAFISTES
jgi:hypothetical protein